MLAVQQAAAIKSFTEELNIPREHATDYVQSSGYVHDKLTHFEDVINGKFRADLVVARNMSRAVVGLGEISCRYPLTPYPCLGSMYIHPDYQGGGVGGMLLDSLLSPYIDARVVLEAPDGTLAVAFYQRHGFQLTGEGYHSTRFPNLIALPQLGYRSENFYQFRKLGLLLPLVAMERLPRIRRMVGLEMYEEHMEKRRLAAVALHPTTR